MDELIKDIKSKEADCSIKLQEFLKEYEKEFKEDLVNKRIVGDITETEVFHQIKNWIKQEKKALPHVFAYKSVLISII